MVLMITVFHFQGCGSVDQLCKPRHPQCSSNHYGLGLTIGRPQRQTPTDSACRGLDHVRSNYLCFPCTTNTNAILQREPTVPIVRNLAWCCEEQELKVE